MSELPGWFTRPVDPVKVRREIDSATAKRRAEQRRKAKRQAEKQARKRAR